MKRESGNLKYKMFMARDVDTTVLITGFIQKEIESLVAKQGRKKRGNGKSR